MEKQVSLASTVLVYCAYFIGLVVFINIAVWALITYNIMGSQSVGVLGWLPIIIAAMMAGQRYGKLSGAKATRGYAWSAALSFVLVSIVISAGMVALVATFFDPQLGVSLRQLPKEIGNDMGLVLGLVAMVLVIFVAFTTLIFNTGVKQGIAYMAKQAGR